MPAPYSAGAAEGANVGAGVCKPKASTGPMRMYLRIKTMSTTRSAE